MICFLEGCFAIDMPYDTLTMANAIGESGLFPLRVIIEKGVRDAVKGIGLALFVGEIIPTPFEGFHQRFFV